MLDTVHLQRNKFANKGTPSVLWLACHPVQELCVHNNYRMDIASSGSCLGAITTTSIFGSWCTACQAW